MNSGRGRVERRLAAILTADVAGYSRLMGEDEEGTLAALKAIRREALAAPGGICVSRVVRDQVRDKLDFGFEDLGEQQVKNIAPPVRVCRIPLAETGPAKTAGGRTDIRR